MFSPNTVSAVSAKVTTTVPSPPPPESLPLPFWPECIARALRDGTVAVNVPPETVTLWEIVQPSANCGILYKENTRAT